MSHHSALNTHTQSGLDVTAVTGGVPPPPRFMGPGPRGRPDFMPGPRGAFPPPFRDAAQDPSLHRRVYVGNLGYRVTSQDLRDLMMQVAFASPHVLPLSRKPRGISDAKCGRVCAR